MKRFLSLLITLAVSTTRAEDKPNVLLITADDLGLQLSCYGDSYIETPHVDTLAASGVKFETAYVTTASCSASRSSMFTGLYPHATGQIGLTNRGFTLFEDQVGLNLPAYLKSAGYRSGILGKLHVAPERSFPFDYRPTKQDTRDVKKVAAEAATFIQQGDDPFFLMVNYSDPHVWKANPNAPAGFPPQWKGIPADPIAPDTVPGWNFQEIDEPEARRRVSNYYNTVKRLDEGVGFLLAELEKAGKSENTLVIFLGDHGPPFNRAKTTCYEAGLRVPFLVRWPGVAQAGLVSEAMVSAVDIVPTLLDAAGVDSPNKFHGASLRPVVSTDEVPETWRDHLVAEHQYHGNSNFFPRRAIRDQRYKLIHNLLAGKAKPVASVDSDRTSRFLTSEKYAGSRAAEAHERWIDPPEFELYDLEKDPHEFENLAGSPDLASVQAGLMTALKEWQLETGDPLTKQAGIERFQQMGNEAQERWKKR